MTDKERLQSIVRNEIKSVAKLKIHFYDLKKKADTADEIVLKSTARAKSLHAAAGIAEHMLQNAEHRLKEYKEALERAK